MAGQRPKRQTNTRTNQQQTTTTPSPEEIVAPVDEVVAEGAEATEAVEETITDRVTVETPEVVAPQQTEVEAEPKPEVVITTPDAEVKTLAKGVTISTPASASPETKAVTIEGFIKNKYNLDPENYTDTLKRVIRGFNAYNSVMNARCPVDLTSAAKHQERWLRVILDALEAPTADSIMCFDAILFLANHNRETLFNDRLACRAFNLMSDQIRDLFLALQTLITNAANPRTRAKYIKEQVRLDKITSLLRSDNQKTNLQAYFARNL